jgi:hypothetical protein
MHPDQRSSQGRAQRKALGIRRRVGASGAALDGSFPPKARKKRWATYNGLPQGIGFLKRALRVPRTGIFGEKIAFSTMPSEAEETIPRVAELQ